MGRLLRGLLLGLGLSLLFVPLRSQEMRRMIGARLRSLLPARPDSIPLLQPAQQATQQHAETVSALSNSTHYAQQAAVQSSTREQTAPAMPLVAPAEQHEAAMPPVVQNPPPPSIPAIEQSLLPPKPEPLIPFEQPEALQPTLLPANESTEDTSPTTKLPVLRPRNTVPLATAPDSAVSTKDTIEAIDIPEATPATHEPVEGTDPTYPTLEPDLDMTPISPTSVIVSDEVSTLAETDPAIATENTPEVPPEALAQSEPHRAELSGVPGITIQILDKLAEEGIHTIPQLLERASNKDGRSELAHKIGLGTNALRALVSRADLMQLHDLDADTATLMQEANVIGCKDLQRRNPENLLATLTDVQARKRLGGRIPSLEQLIAWIAATAK